MSGGDTGRPGAAVRPVAIGATPIGGASPLGLIAGPCQIESADHARRMAAALRDLARQLPVGLVFKASFDKANRTSLGGARGVGMAEGLRILAGIRAEFGLPVLSDVHLPEQCAPAAACLDALQIPAFLCRQTDLLLAAGATGRPVMIKKGQFLAPGDMRHAAAKVASTGNRQILLCERGSSFGYHCLVADFRSLPILAGIGHPVVFDATHSVQAPGGIGAASGGDRRFAPVLARAAVAAGADAVFVETHDDPDRAPSDGPVMLPLAAMPELVRSLLRIRAAVLPAAEVLPAAAGAEGAPAEATPPGG